MRWVKLFNESELPEGTRKVLTIEDHSILTIREHNHIYAMVSSCPHMRLPLKGGKITEEGAIVCPFHHSAFDLETGDVKAWSPWPPVMGKMLGSLSREKALRLFETKIEEGAIWIALDN